MRKKEIYPKTMRIKEDNCVTITEKLDGSNLCIFKKDDVLYIAQRKTILSIDEIEEQKNLLYKGLYQWLIDNREELETIRNESVVCGEWLGMGKVKYTIDEFDKKFYMFAKANIDDDFNLYNLYYNHYLFTYPFENLEIPKCIGIVPIVSEINYIPSKITLDKLYDGYTNKCNRKVEGFVIDFNNNITKYVRMKNGKVVEYSSNDRKSEVE